jgi:hypothetical protein
VCLWNRCAMCWDDDTTEVVPVWQANSQFTGLPQKALAFIRSSSVCNVHIDNPGDCSLKRKRCWQNVGHAAVWAWVWWGHYATSRKVTGSIPDGVIAFFFFNFLNPLYSGLLFFPSTQLVYCVSYTLYGKNNNPFIFTQQDAPNPPLYSFNFGLMHPVAHQRRDSTTFVGNYNLSCLYCARVTLHVSTIYPSGVSSIYKC